MDATLLNQLKATTYKYKPISEHLVNFAIDDIQKRIEELVLNLFNLKVETVTDCITYTHQHNIIKSITSLAQIVAFLISEQERQIAITNLAITKKDDSIYFSSKKINKMDKCDVPENLDLNEEILNMITDRKRSYIKFFGYFKDKESADKIIKKEFDDVSKYMNVLLKINELKYDEYNNYDPLINGCQTLLYELIQLVIALIKAEESNIINKINNSKPNNIKSYFLIMDFVNSRTIHFHKWNDLIDNIKRINNKLNEIENIGMLCKMNVYKQDEVQGVFIGDIERFLQVLENEIISDIKVAYSEFNIFDKDNGIINIADSVYNNPFALNGNPCYDSRNKLTNFPILIKSVGKI